jgi:hypothetical protein
MTNWAKGVPLHASAVRDTTRCRCNELVRAGEPIVWIEGLRAPGQAHVRYNPTQVPDLQSVDPGPLTSPGRAQ